jgi:regulatory protein
MSLEDAAPTPPGEKELLDLALGALARRAFSCSEMARRLEKAGGKATAIQKILSRLVSQGYLDDRKYAESFVQNRKERKSWGRARVLRELKAKGVPLPLIEAVMESTFSTEDENVLLERALEKKWRSLAPRINKSTGIDAKILSRLYNYLFRQGFPSEKIQKALRQKVRFDYDFE